MRTVILVLRAAEQSKGNAAAQALRDAGAPFDVELVDTDTPGTVAAYWCGWTMTDEEYEQILTALDDEGLTRVTPVVPGSARPGVKRALYVYDREDWTPNEVLEHQGYAIYDGPPLT